MFEGRTSALAAWNESGASARAVLMPGFRRGDASAWLTTSSDAAQSSRFWSLARTRSATWVIDLIEDAHGLRPRPVGGIDVARAVVDAAEMFERVCLVEPVG
jgi:hypothetical protein